MKTCKKHIKDPVICYSDCAGCEMQRLTDERNKLKAENERLTAMLAEWDRSPHGKMVLKIMELRKSVERYRFLRDKQDLMTASFAVVDLDSGNCIEDMDWLSGDQLDARVDAAMSKESPNG